MHFPASGRLLATNQRAYVWLLPADFLSLPLQNVCLILCPFLCETLSQEDPGALGSQGRAVIASGGLCSRPHTPYGDPAFGMIAN
jgi:hypothetical protein